ncbi:unnamed protein product [Mesocestoides corti]|uniref:Carrier domain-containing protein n=1 Tax=Mesocestoides corti TaxID=53468 RepID=A0A0R3UC95_MESCO|nr:unnamed protein product [Mesocestoides corti]
MAPNAQTLKTSQSVGLFYPRLLRGNSNSCCAFCFTPGIYDVNRYARSGGLSRSAITEMVRLVLCSSSKINPNQLTTKSDLRQEFAFDQVDRIDVALVMETLFAISISHDHLDEHFTTPLDIVDYICKRRGVD